MAKRRSSLAAGAMSWLVGRKADLAIVQPDAWTATVRSWVARSVTALAPVTVSVRRVAADGGPFVLAAPVPQSTITPVVEVALVDPNARREQERQKVAGGRRTDTGRDSRAQSRSRSSARGCPRGHQRVTKQPASSTERNGEEDDPRVAG